MHHVTMYVSLTVLTFKGFFRSIVLFYSPNNPSGHVEGIMKLIWQMEKLKTQLS